jgi:hypothetical protein
MDHKFRLIHDMDQRKRAMLDELSIVQDVLSRAVRTQETEHWITKLEKWRQDLHQLIENMPTSD